jgi:hypothetical protein
MVIFQLLLGGISSLGDTGDSQRGDDGIDHNGDDENDNFLFGEIEHEVLLFFLV